MMNQDYCKLGDVATYINGYAFKPSDWGVEGVPIVRIQDLTGNSYQSNYFSGEIDSRYRVHPGDILISWSASLGIFEWQRGDAVLNQHIFKVVFDKKVVDKKFFVHQIRMLLERFANEAHGATMKHLTRPVFNALPFYAPPLALQKKISFILECVSTLIAISQRRLEIMDQLAKSRFIEMFGDPAENPKGWYQTPIGDILEGKASNGFFAKREEYVEKGNAAVIGVANVVNRMYSQIEGLQEVLVGESDIKKYSVKYGDILFCRSSLVKEGIAKASIIPHEVAPNTLFECHVIRLPLDLQKAIPEFIQMQTTTPFFREQVISQSKTATMTTISQDGILKTKIIVPPLALQNEFTAFIEELDKSKVAGERQRILLEKIAGGGIV